MDNQFSERCLKYRGVAMFGQGTSVFDEVQKSARAGGRFLRTLRKKVALS